MSLSPNWSLPCTKALLAEEAYYFACRLGLIMVSSFHHDGSLAVAISTFLVVPQSRCGSFKVKSSREMS